MTPRQRLIQALNGLPVDRPPCICPGGMMNMVTVDVQRQCSTRWPEAHQDPLLMADLAEAVHHLTGIENLGAPFCMTVEAEAMGAIVQIGTVASEPRIIGYPLQALDDWTSLPALCPDAGRAAVVCETISRLANRNPDLPVIANLTGPISLAASLLEPMVFFKAMGKQPEQVHEFLGFIAENLAAFGAAMLQAGAQVITVSDPSGTGEILGPRRFHEFALPYINQVLDSLHGQCQASMVHICGQLHSVFAEIDRLHTDSISIDSVTSVSLLKAALHDKVIAGNVSTQLLHDGKPERVQAAALSCLKRGAGILSPACGLSLFTPTDNLRALTAAACDWNPAEEWRPIP